ncbi:lipopolysaccharide biosynthesis protein [Cryobacterium suzukii]|nr:oligosaccharide flippase family protein [Cryobacterium suzukii]
MTKSDRVDFSWAKTTTWLLSATVLRNVGLIVILVLLARLTSTEVVGRYAIALAITTPIFIMGQFGLKNVYLTMHQNFRFGSYVAIQFVMIALAFLVSVGVALVFNRDLTLTVALVSVIKVADTLSEFFSAPLQKYHSAPRIFWAYLISAILGSAVTGLALVYTRDLDIALAGLAGTSLFVALALMWVPAQRLAHHREDAAFPALSRVREDRKTIIRAGFPTGVAGAILALVSSMPQYFLARDHGESAVGSFVVLLYIFAIADIFSGTLTQAWIPRARESLRRTTESRPLFFLQSVLKATGWWTLVLVPVAIFGLLLMSLLLPVVFGSGYSLSFAEAVPLAVGILVLPATYFGSTAVAVQNFYVHGLTLGIAAAGVSLMTCLVLVPPFGAAGALWAVALAYGGRGVVAIAILYPRARPATTSA